MVARTALESPRLAMIDHGDPFPNLVLGRPCTTYITNVHSVLLSNISLTEQQKQDISYVLPKISLFNLSVSCISWEIVIWPKRLSWFNPKKHAMCIAYKLVLWQHWSSLWVMCTIWHVIQKSEKLILLDIWYISCLYLFVLPLIMKGFLQICHVHVLYVLT